MKTILSTFLFLALVVFLSCDSPNVESKKYQIDDTGYELPYGVPEKSEVIDVLVRVSDYIMNSTSYQVINKDSEELITDFTVIDTNAVVDTRKGSFNLWEYTVGVIHTGMLALSETLEDKKYTDYVIANYDFIFDHLPYFRELAGYKTPVNGTFHRIINMSALDHCGSIGAALVQTEMIHNDSRYRDMIDTVENYIMNRQFRLPDGTLARERPQKTSVWTDDFYMSVPFLARMGEYTADTLYFNEAVKQVLQLSGYLFRTEQKLYDHGTNLNTGKYDPNFFWGRANGWAMLSITSLLDVLPADYHGRDQILDIYRSHIQRIAELQSGNGLWHNMLDKTDTYPETSCTAMFTYCMAKAVNEGWIDHTFSSVALAGWNGLSMYISPEGRIENMCAGTTFGADLVYYYHRPPSYTSLHGFGPVLLAGSEIVKLLENQKIHLTKEHRAVHAKLN